MKKSLLIAFFTLCFTSIAFAGNSHYSFNVYTADNTSYDYKILYCKYQNGEGDCSKVIRTGSGTELNNPLPFEGDLGFETKYNDTLLFVVTHVSMKMSQDENVSRNYSSNDECSTYQRSGFNSNALLIDKYPHAIYCHKAT